MAKGKQNKNAAQLILEICSISIEAIKEKLRISPVGKVTGIDGRVFQIDGQAILDRLISTELELVLNVGHEYNGAAAGWFTQFELRSDGIYANLALNEDGEELIAKKKYKYLSPEYLVDYDTNEVMHIVGVGLVNQPNLLNEALNNIENKPPVEGNAMTPEEKAAQEALSAENETLKAQVDTLTKAQNSLQKEQRTVKVDNAIAGGELAPAKRDFALGLAANSLDSFLEMESKTFTKTDKNNIDPDQQSGDGLSGDDADCDVFDQLGLNEDEQGE